MKTELLEVIPYQEVVHCEQCNKGTLNRKGSLMMNDDNSITVPHECNNCGHKQVFQEEYPRIVFKLK